MIEKKEETVISQAMERHFKILINGKEVWVSKWYSADKFNPCGEGDTEIFKGQDLLTEEEQEEVIDFVNDL